MFNKILTEGRVELLVVLTQILKVIGVPAICYLCYLGVKLITLHVICKHPELSDDKKVKYITRMVAETNINLTYLIIVIYLISS